MFKRQALDVNSIFDNMHENLIKNASKESDDEKYLRAFENMKIAAEYFEDVGHTNAAKYVTSLMEKFAEEDGEPEIKDEKLSEGPDEYRRELLDILGDDLSDEELAKMNEDEIFEDEA